MLMTAPMTMIIYACDWGFHTIWITLKQGTINRNIHFAILLVTNQLNVDHLFLEFCQFLNNRLFQTNQLLKH